MARKLGGKRFGTTIIRARTNKVASTNIGPVKAGQLTMLRLRSKKGTKKFIPRIDYSTSPGNKVVLPANVKNSALAVKIALAH